MTFRARKSVMSEDWELPFLNHDECAKFAAPEIIFRNIQETQPLNKLPEKEEKSMLKDCRTSAWILSLLRITLIIFLKKTMCTLAKTKPLPYFFSLVQPQQRIKCLCCLRKLYDVARSFHSYNIVRYIC